MKKVIYGSLSSLLILFTLGGCSGDDADTKTKTNNAPAADMKTSQDMKPTPDMATPEDMKPSPDMGVKPDMTKEEDMAPGQVTYYQHVKPIIDQACVGCHVSGNIGPFELDTYEKVKPLSAAIEMAITRGTMPPWLPKEQCGEFRYKRDLNPSQLDTIKRWVAAGSPAGDPNATPEAQPAYEQVQLGAPTMTIDLGTDYVPAPPENKTDDYRCFVIDPKLSKDEFLSAFETKPGNAAIVHHMLLFSVPGSEQGKIDQLSAAEPEAPGYTCFGGPKVDNNLLGVWAPGVVPVKFPDGYGMPLKKGELLVMQVHYNTLNGSGSDRTSVDLHFATGPTKKLVMLPVADNNLSIAPGDSEAVEGASFDLPNLPITLKLFGVVPHMHARGKRISVKLVRQGQEQCLIDIPSWDFNWQNVYIYKDPIEVRGGDSVKLECVYDNSPARNQELGLTGPPNNPITWGEGTLDEMCLNYVILEDIRP